MCDNTNTTTQSIADYLSQLLKDRKQLAAFPNVFIHVERLLDEGKRAFPSVLEPFVRGSDIRARSGHGSCVIRKGAREIENRVPASSWAMNRDASGDAFVDVGCVARAHAPCIG